MTGEARGCVPRALAGLAVSPTPRLRTAVCAVGDELIQRGYRLLFTATSAPAPRRMHVRYWQNPDFCV